MRGQVALVSGDSWAARLVQAVIGSSYNHVIVGVAPGICVSAEPGGAVLRAVSHYTDQGQSVVWSQQDLTPDQARAIGRWAVQHVGTPYSWVDFLAAGAAALLKHHTPRFIRERTANPHRLICSQLADLALQAGNVHLFQDHRPIGAVTPASFAHVFIQYGWTDEP